MKFCAVFRIDLDSISALHFSVVDAFKEKTAFTVYQFFFQLPQSFNPKVVLSQLRYSGMLETVRIRRAGFPVRRTYEDFLFRYFFYRFHTLVIRELNQPRRRPQRRLQKKKKTVRLMIKTTALHVYMTLFSTFLWRPLHDYDLKPPNLTLYGGLGHTTTNFPSSFWAWIKSLRIQLQGKSPAFGILSGSK